MTTNEIEVEAVINAPIGKVWDYYILPEHITKWAFASDDWEAPHAENDVKVGGKFLTTMAAKDKSTQFDFTGIYTTVKEHQLLAYTMDDGRKASVRFEPMGEKVKVVVVFEMENENSRKMQKSGWQAILDNFKKHVETA